MQVGLPLHGTSVPLRAMLGRSRLQNRKPGCWSEATAGQGGFPPALGGMATFTCPPGPLPFLDTAPAPPATSHQPKQQWQPPESGANRFPAIRPLSLCPFRLGENLPNHFKQNHAGSAFRLRRQEPIRPSTPTLNSAQVPGSGTAVTGWVSNRVTNPEKKGPSPTVSFTPTRE
jgi:hypothetical protein